MDFSNVGEIIVGSLPGVGALLLYLHKIDRDMVLFRVEHEILINWYAEQHNILPEQLPTRRIKK